MSFNEIVFYAFSAILIFASLRVITSRNPVHAALWLVLAFCTSAGLWIQLEAEFLAITLVLVYVGAVMVLFLFVVMMLDINLERVREGFWRNLPLALGVGGIMVVEMVLVLGNRIFGSAPAPVAPGYSNTRALGRVLYTQYAYAFEIAAVLLLVAIISAIALTLRRRKDSRYQDPSLQVKVRRRDRVRMVPMKPETEK